MKVSIVVCTWNRAALLDEALGSLGALEVPAGLAWELLVVENACTDATEAVVRRHAARLPLRGVSEPALGLSHARNRALVEARGALLLWLDDDIRVEPGWLAAYLGAADAHPEATFFGGPIEPRFLTPPPAWARCADVIEGPLAAIQLGPDTRPFGPGETPYGGNMAMRAAALGPRFFDVDRGRIGEDLRGGEEVALFEALVGAGQRGVWVGCARVAHTIPPERLTPRYLFAYYRAQGRLPIWDLPNPGPRILGGVPWPWWRGYASARVEMLRRWRRDQRWAQAVEDAGRQRGRIDRVLDVRRTAGSAPPGSAAQSGLQ